MSDGTVNVNFSVDSSGLDKGLSAATQKVKKAAEAQRSAFVITAGDIANFMNKVLSAIPDQINASVRRTNELYDQIKRLGVAAESFQSLRAAADDFGISAGELGNVISTLQVNLGKGTKETQSALKALGLDLNTLKNQDGTIAFEKIATALSHVRNKSDQAALGVTLYGKAYKDAAGFINSDIQGNIKQFEELGLVLSTTQIEAVKSFKNSRDDLGDIFNGFFDKVTAEASPALKDMTDQLINFVKESGGIDVVAKQFANDLVTGIELTISTMKVLIETAGLLKSAFQEVGGGIYSAFDELDQHLENGIFALQKKIGITPKSEREAAERLQVAQAARDNRPTTVTNTSVDLSGIKGGATATVLFKDRLVEAASAISAHTVAIGKFTKKADDAFSVALEAKNGTSEQIERILKGAATKPIAVDENFDAIASSVLERVQNGAKREDVADQLKQLGQLSSANGFDGAQDHSAQKNALNELYKYINNTTGQKVDVQLSLKPTPYAIVEWVNSPDGVKLLSAQQSDQLASDAAAIANN